MEVGGGRQREGLACTAASVRWRDRVLVDIAAAAG